MKIQLFTTFTSIDLFVLSAPLVQILSSWYKQMPGLYGTKGESGVGSLQQPAASPNFKILMTLWLFEFGNCGPLVKVTT